MFITDTYQKLRDLMSDLFGLAEKAATPIPDPKKPDEVADFVRNLFDEGLDFERDHFQDTKDLRPQAQATGIAVNTPDTFRKACDLLEASNDHQVWGQRNNTPKTAWKQERVDGLIDRQMRTRRRYIAGNYHDISILPNIQHIGEILDQERDAIGWGSFIKKCVATAQKYGTATARVLLDTGEDIDHVTPIICEAGSVSRTPHSTSYLMRDGCWYAVHGTMLNDKQVETQYTGIDMTELKSATNLYEKYTHKIEKREYNHTKLYPKLECFFDDPGIEESPLTPDEQAELESENEILMQGKPVEARADQNHKKHIALKTDGLQKVVGKMPDEGELQAEDDEFSQRVAQAYSDNIQAHLAFISDEDLSSQGLRRKYPFGRYVCTVGGKVVQDGPNPYRVAWRKLFRDVKNEEVVGRIDGKGDPEILWNDAKTADISLSRIDDLILSVTATQSGIKVQHSFTFGVQSDRA